MLRLYHVVWLKRLGLKLVQIGTILHDRNVDLDRLLGLQEEVLLDRKRSIDQALRLVGKARAKLTRGDALSTDELIALTKETAMTSEHPDWTKKISPLVDKHLSQADKDGLEKRYDIEAWRGLIADARSLLGTDPAAPAALALAGKWKAMTAALTGDRPELKQKLKNIQQDAWADPQTAPTFPITPDVMEFIKAAVANLEAQKH